MTTITVDVYNNKTQHNATCSTQCNAFSMTAHATADWQSGRCHKGTTHHII